ncbi:VOC family protein [Curtobacterium sp. MCJR17_055]|uniref:VOC family protein n=1 Tax=unclassified Curtobacterium TaxID=257496 RepID=UPI000D8B0B24|nr:MULTISPECIES: VOC family protein [unclassified Curtobacterium]PYY32824.1 VOC family protein [Curtobacterium sp. MCBD17_029]PYY54078.1 VOC family protein [Curtobacterium sp. MCJR17_055]PYY55947.1 VOC family protein [Curtobacterium sp. MCPF17_015]WIB34712.1 VOC family protein [Curtobacterium sp. MCJR17_043]
MTDPIARPIALAHVRVTVTDIVRSKAFYQQLFGVEPAMDFSEHAGEPGITEDRERLYGGCIFPVGDQLFGLRPVAPSGQRFDPDTVGLDHVSFMVGSVDELHEAAARLDAAGVEHGEVTDLGDAGMVILSVQDPDDINLELAAVRS